MSEYQRPDRFYRDALGSEIPGLRQDSSGVNYRDMLQDPSARAHGFGDGSELRAYYPSPRERFAQWILGDNPSYQRQDAIKHLIGSDGLGTSFGLLDLTPAGIPLGFNEAIRSRDPLGAVLSIVPNEAVGRAAVRAGKQFFARPSQGALNDARSAATEFIAPRVVGPTYNSLQDQIRRIDERRRYQAMPGEPEY